MNQCASPSQRDQKLNENIFFNTDTEKNSEGNHLDSQIKIKAFTMDPTILPIINDQ